MQESPLFVDFHLIVNSASGGSSNTFYTVVADAPASHFGHQFGQFTLQVRDKSSPLSEEPGLFVHRNAQNILYIARDSKIPMTPDQVGTELFKLLFPRNSAALRLLAESCGHVGNGYLRIKLEVPTELSELPWERMRCPLAELENANINAVPMLVVRYLGHVRPHKWQPDPPASPEIILVKSDPKPDPNSDPEDLMNRQMVSSSLDAEVAILRNLLRDRASVTCTVLEGVGTVRGLRSAVRAANENSRTVTGLHVLGHGGFDESGSFIVGEDDLGKETRIYAQQLLDALDEAKSLRWAILNTCWSAAAPIESPLAGLATALASVKDIPTVIAYKRPVQTKDAESLAVDFYREVIIDGGSVQKLFRSLQIRFSGGEGMVLLAKAAGGAIQDRILLSAGKPASHQKPGESSSRKEPSSVKGKRKSNVPPSRSSGAVPRRHARHDEVGEMVRIPGGPFRKGLTSAQIAFLIKQFNKHGLMVAMDSAHDSLRAEPQSSVELPEFFMDRTLVTNEQFRRFVEATDYTTVAESADESRTWRSRATSGKENYPVVFVTYRDAEEFCRWAGKRLPTADEWKKAFRGPDGSIYPWGDTFDYERCNTAESCSGFETTPVDMFPSGASCFGCLDMVGNVEEWTATTENEACVIIGGSWKMSCEVYGLPVLNRFGSPTLYLDELGFRCARDP